ncbi:hypothetical protein JL720_16537 [Aureococcus anophagefferens]|nr:hypothetical protein JL720_16537 [Aureococcus anophagefferens]
MAARRRGAGSLRWLRWLCAVAGLVTGCEDSSSWYIAGKPPKDCAWIASNPTNRCFDDKLDESGVASEIGCPATCSNCPVAAPSAAPTTAAPSGDGAAPTGSVACEYTGNPWVHEVALAQGETMVIEEIRATQQNIWVELDATADIDLLLQTAAGETILEFDGASSTHWYPNQQSFAFNGITIAIACPAAFAASLAVAHQLTGTIAQRGSGANTERRAGAVTQRRTGAIAKCRARAFAERCTHCVSVERTAIVAIANSYGFTVELALAQTDAGTDADADALSDADSWRSERCSRVRADAKTDGDAVVRA